MPIFQPLSCCRLIAAGSVAMLLAGCAQFSPDGGMGPVTQAVHQEVGKDVVAIRTQDDADSSRASVQALLRRGLTADSAVQIALLNNRGLQAAFNDLALAEAERVGESLPPNPGIALSRISGPFEIEIERRIVADLIGFATLPFRSEIAAERFRRAQLRAILETIRTAAETRLAYYRAVAGRELVGYLGQAQQATDTMTQFAKRLGETGAMNKLDQARELAFFAELTAQLATARQRATSDREALIRRMGLWGPDLEFKLASTLPALPRKARTLANIEVEAIRRRIDLQMGRIELAALARSYGLTQATRFISFLDAGYADKILKEKETGERIRERGFELEFEIPIFDFGEVRVREAEARYMAAVNRLLELAINVRSEARDAYRVYRSTHDIATHYTREVLPLRKIITDEAQLRYNGMLIDVFGLLTESRQRIAATTAAIDAKREFWLANTNLGTAVLGGGGESAGAGAASTQMSNAAPGGAGH
jgi:outer membrane protein TolC